MTATTTKKVLRVGLDLGTNSTVFEASRDGKAVKYEKNVFPSIVGYSKPGIIPGILPTESNSLFADDALEYRLHLELKWPLKNGFIQDIDSCKEFAGFLREQINPKRSFELWGVVGAPANADAEKQKLLRTALGGMFERILIVPEPFLAAMGLRDEELAKSDPEYVDPTKHSLIIDVGAGTTDCCLVHGYFPGPEDQLSIPIAGDSIDETLSKSIKERYPDVALSRITVTRLKESNAFVGRKKSAEVKVYADGKPRKIDFGEILKESCEILVDPILKCTRELFARCDSESVIHVMKNIIVSGGGSQIRGLANMIQKKLHAEGYEDAQVTTPADYCHLVAGGALKIANNVREDQWQVPL